MPFVQTANTTFLFLVSTPPPASRRVFCISLVSFKRDIEEEEVKEVEEENVIKGVGSNQDKKKWEKRLEEEEKKKTQ